MLDFERRERKVLEWCQASFAQRLDLPTDHEWQSTDGAESQLVMAWTGESFSNSWAYRIVDRVRDHLSGALWSHHRDALLETCCDFFGRWDPTTVLNAVTATPSRMLFSHWAGTGAYALTQHQRPNTDWINGRAPLNLNGLGSAQRLPMHSWEWSGCGARPHTVFWSNHRTYRGRSFPEWRVFIANRDGDATALKEGKLPELDAIVAAEGNGVRAPTPMIHFWRASASGSVAMLVLEITPEGKLLSIRWSRQPFNCFMLAHVWYFEALDAAFGRRTRLWTP